MNDSGVGISTPGSMDRLIDYWGGSAFFPESCDECIGEDGHLTGYHDYQLSEDPNVRLGYLSTRQDGVVVERSSDLTGPAFEAALEEAVAELKAAHPERFNSVVADGDGHTFILRDFDREVGGVSVRQWVGDMVGQSESWASVAD